MDTPTAISQLETLSQNLGAQSGILATQKTAVDIAVSQLKGLLDTPSADLITEKEAHTNDVAALTSEKSALSVAYDNALAEKDALITESATKDTRIEDLQAQMEALTPKDVPVESPVEPATGEI